VSEQFFGSPFAVVASGHERSVTTSILMLPRTITKDIDVPPHNTNGTSLKPKETGFYGVGFVRNLPRR
jgi:hypothetical protein